MHRAGRRILCWLILVIPAMGVARADVLWLDDGTMHRGEVQRQSTKRVVFRTQIDGIWVDLAITRDTIKELIKESGDQAPGEVAPKSDDAASAPAPATEDRVAPDRGEPPPAPHIAMIPLRGQVGGLIDGSIVGTFDAELLTLCLDEAASRGAEVVVLDIDSPGGYLTEMEAICELILARREQQRIVAYARDALSAAAVIALTCPELVVRSESRVGAAVMVQPSAEGMTAVEAKFASPHHALQRRYLDQSGQPYALLAAMTIQERELFWSPTEGFTTAPGESESAESTRVDGATTVLTMVAEDAVKWKVAKLAKDRSELAGCLAIDEELPLVDYDDVVEHHTETTTRRLGMVLEQFQAYFQSLSRIYDVLGDLQAEARGGDQRKIRRSQAELRRLIDTAQTAGKAIGHQDHRLLARRTDVPDGLIDQLDRDAETLKEITRLGRQASTGSLNQARRSAQRVLESWRQLMQ